MVSSYASRCGYFRFDIFEAALQRRREEKIINGIISFFSFIFNVLNVYTNFKMGFKTTNSSTQFRCLLNNYNDKIVKLNPSRVNDKSFAR